MSASTTAAARRLTSVKVVVAGTPPRGGDTAFVRAVCDIGPLTMHAAPTPPGGRDDDTAGTQGAVGVDFGRIVVAHSRIDIDGGVTLYLFGAPGADRARPLWDEVCHGAVGAVVLADTYRLADHAAAVAYADSRRLPYVVALQQTTRPPDRDLAGARSTLRLPATVPLLACDVYDRDQVRRTLIALVEHARDQATPTCATPYHRMKARTPCPDDVHE